MIFGEKPSVTYTANIRPLVAMPVHVGCIISFVHESLLTDVAVQTKLSLVSLHVILVSCNRYKSSVANVAVIPRRSGTGS